MQLTDLRKEIRSHQTHIQKMRLQISMHTEKNTGRYRSDKRQLARMMTVLTEKEKEAKAAQSAKGPKERLSVPSKKARVSPPTAPRSGKKAVSKKSPKISPVS